MYERLEEFLLSKQATYEMVDHPGAVSAQEQAAVSHTSGWAFAKVVVVKDRDGYVLAVVPAACVVDLDRLKGLIGHGEVRLATVEEIGAAVPDCAAGAIPPVGALYGMPTFVDRSLLNVRDVTMPAGDLGTAVRMRSDEFERLAQPRVGDFAVPEALVAQVSPSTRARKGRP